MDEDFEVVKQKIRNLVAGKKVPAFEGIDTIEYPNLFVSKNIPGREYYSDPIRVDINMVHNDILDVEEFVKWRDDLAGSEFIFEKTKTEILYMSADGKWRKCQNQNITYRIRMTW